jgi:pimeloyl-ACP methyl ester carboxylesterase
VNSNVHQSGEGDNVILIHGLGGNLRTWDPIAAVLEQRFKVLRYDLRGHGKSENPQGPWLLDDFISDLEDVVLQAGITRTHLAGFSLGGLISQGFTIKHPEVVDKLIILSAVAGRTEAERAKVVERVHNLEIGDLDSNIELAMERWFSPEFRAQHPELVKARLDTLRSNDPMGYLNAYRVFGLGDLGNQIDRIKCPTLVMTGEFDPGSNVRMSQLMHEKISNSKLEILPNLRHSVLVEAPQLIAEKFDNFF